MATWTKATLATRTLEFLAVVGEGESPTGQQQVRTEEVIDSVFQQLQALGLAPFAVATIPEWAQQPLVKLVSVEVAPRFGVSGQRLMELAGMRKMARNELAEQVAVHTHELPVTVDYY